MTNDAKPNLSTDALDKVFASSDLHQYQNREWFLLVKAARAELAAQVARLAELEGIDRAYDELAATIPKYEETIAALKAAVKETTCLQKNTSTDPLS